MKRRWFAAIVIAACGDNVGSQLVRVSEEPPGDHCETGGSAVAVGIDRNNDGVLQDAEIDSVAYVCNGPPGSNGTQVLVDTRPEPMGSNCLHGGVAIDSGIDLDDDGMLDSTEVQQTVYVCNGDDGAATLVVTRPEPPGINCSLGGTALLVGRDVDGNGVLDPAEVTSTSFLCNTSVTGTLDGNYTIHNELDVILLAGVTNITGGLLSFFNAPPDIELTDLQTAGSLVLQGGGVLKLPALRAVTAGASLTCREAQLPVLETVGASLSVGSLPLASTQMRFADLPQLKSVGGDFSPLGQLRRVSAPKLETFKRMQVGFDELLDLDLASLRSVELIQIPAPQLPALRLPRLATAQTVIVFVPAATVFDMSALQDATTLLRLAAHQLTTLRFDALTHVGELRIEDVPALTSLQMPALTSIGGPVTVIAPQLPICQIDAILTQANYTGPRTIQAAPGPCP